MSSLNFTFIQGHANILSRLVEEKNDAHKLLDTVAEIFARMTPYYDRFSLYEIGHGRNHRSNCMLPLDSTYSTRRVRRCIDTIRSLSSTTSQTLDLSSSVTQILHSLSNSLRREALAHLVIITNQTEIALPTMESFGRLRIHTISQYPSCRIAPINDLNGCHIVVDFGSGDYTGHLSKNISMMFRALRSDLYSGVLKSLSVQSGAQVQCVLDHFDGILQCPSLRVGERWPLTVYLKVPKSLGLTSATTLKCSLVKNAESRTDRCRIQYSEHPVLFNLSLTYQHTLLPDFASITTLVTCQLEQA